MAAKKPQSPFDFDLTKMVADMQVPGVDMDALLDSQRRNMEAIASANKLAYEGVQALMRRQGEILRQTLEEASAVATKLSDADTPQARVAKQTELTKEAFEKSLSNMRELAELVAKSNDEVVQVLNSRFSALMDEIAKTAEGKK